jgi:TonB family protein
MNVFENDEMTDLEVSEALALWCVPDPSPDLRVRVFAAVQPWYQPLVSLWLRGRSFAFAISLQTAAVALLVLTVGTPVVKTVLDSKQIVYLPPFRAKLPPAAQKASGGGGQNASTPAANGHAPKFANKQFVPPTIAVERPHLPAEPTITAQAPQIEASNYGDPLGKMLGSSFGQGSGQGLGDGSGNGYGPGGGGGTGGGIYRIGGDVLAPVLVSKIEPEYSEEARKAKYQGVVVLAVVVDPQGIPRDIKVIRPLGLGLDQKAVEAVQHWRFRPGTKNGKPVNVSATVEVSFRLL